MSARAEQLAANLAEVRQRIAGACAEAGRQSEDVTLVVVTKFFPVSDVRLLAELGVRDVGENRHQEAEAKAAECADLDLRWHFVGGLQSNKAAAVAAYSEVVESVDRAKLLGGLARGAIERGRDLDCLVQVNLDAVGTQDQEHGDPDRAGTSRGGVHPQGAADLAARIAGTDGLRLRGVMAVAPPGVDPRPAFAVLADLAADVRRTDPAASWISAGMSGDLEAAVNSGATHVRIGSAVLGPRPSLG